MNLKERNVSLESDPYWPDRYEIERERLLEIGEGILGVFHVGSTAIPEVPGKPALDVIAVFEDDTAMEATAQTLIEDHGFERPPEGTIAIRWDDEFAVFLKLHTPDDEKVRAQIAFKEYLRDHPEYRAEYADLKEAAAAEHPENLEAYTKAKGDFVRRVIEDAKADGYYEELPDFV